MEWRTELGPNPAKGRCFGIVLEWTNEAHGVYFYVGRLFGFIGKSL